MRGREPAFGLKFGHSRNTVVIQLFTKEKINLHEHGLTDLFNMSFFFPFVHSLCVPCRLPGL